MKRNELYKLVEESLKQVMVLNDKQLNEDICLYKDLGLDSIDILDFSFELEKRIGMKASVVGYIQKNKLGSVGVNSLKISDLLDYLEDKN
jgi:acyl carrier protein